MTDYNKLIDNIKNILEKECIRDFQVTIDAYNQIDVKLDLAHINAESIEKIEEENKLKFDAIEYSYAPSSGRIIRLRFKKK